MAGKSVQPFVGNTLLIGAVGQLQFEVVEHRLRTEYGVDVTFERAGIHTARWVTCADAVHLAEFTPPTRSSLPRM